MLEALFSSPLLPAALLSSPLEPVLLVPASIVIKPNGAGGSGQHCYRKLMSLPFECSGFPARFECLSLWSTEDPNQLEVQQQWPAL